MQYIKSGFSLIKDTVIQWNEDGAPLLAAALAYYTAFSIAPLLIVVLAIVGIVTNQSDVRMEILQQIEMTMGADVSAVVNDLIENTAKPDQGVISSILGVVALLAGALGVFNNLQTSLNLIWDVDTSEQAGGVKTFLRDKLLSFGMILIIGFLLLVSLILSTVLSFFDEYIASVLPAGGILLYIISMGVSLGITTFLFMMIYKVLPQIDLEWRDVAIGGFVTAVLFTVGRIVLGLYLGNSAVASTYGAAGAFVLILLWVYYSAQILLLGAEFTQVFARCYGSLKTDPAQHPQS